MWAGDKWEGGGLLTYRNGEVIKGMFSGGKANGLGTRLFENGDEYEGEFKAGVVSGRGGDPQTRSRRESLQRSGPIGVRCGATRPM